MKSRVSTAAEKARRAAVRADVLLRGCDACRTRIRGAADDMHGRFEDRRQELAKRIRRHGPGGDATAEREYERCLQSIHVCARIACGSKATSGGDS